MFEPGYLRRQPFGVPAKELTFAALDVETTGLDARVDRVCEIGVVRCRGDEPGSASTPHSSIHAGPSPETPTIATRSLQSW